MGAYEYIRARAVTDNGDGVAYVLKMTSGPMLLGDQPQFLKRTIAVDGTGWVPRFVSDGMNKGTKKVALIDAAILAGGEKPAGAQTVHVPRKDAYAELRKLQEQLAAR